MQLSKERKKTLKDFVSKYKLRFKDFELLNSAFSHTSYTNELGIDRILSYERLEFLGDAVLKLAVSDILYNEYLTKNEGLLSEHRSIVVSDKTIAKFADKIGFSNLILLGNSEVGKKNESILACAFEAFLGAIYLEFKDKGYICAKKFLIDNFKDDILNTEYSNPKAQLQDFTQKLNHNLPEYVLMNESGPAHSKTFTIGVYYENKFIEKGEAKTKKEAEFIAAKAALIKLKEQYKEE